MSKANNIPETELDDFNERMARLEGKLSIIEKPGLRKKIAEYGGLMALFISIIIGGYTLFDKIVREPETEKVQKAEELKEALAKLVDINVKIASLDWVNDREQSLFKSQVWFPTKVSLVDKIENIELRYPGRLNFADRMVLANENEGLGRLDKFLKHSMESFKLASNSFEVANSYWIMARAHGRAQELIKMRNNFDKALKTFHTLGYEANAGHILQLQIQWISYEQSYNECESAKNIFNEFQANYKSPLVFESTRNRIKNEFDKMLLSNNRSCGLNLG
jgi:hypothetical protein